MIHDCGPDMVAPMGRGRKRTQEREETAIGRNLLRLRLKHGLSQRALAEIVIGRGRKIAAPDISRIESGDIREPSAPLLKAVADALGESMLEFWAEPDDIRDRTIRETLAQFMVSDEAKGVTSEEFAELHRAISRVGVPSPEAWREALAAIRQRRPR